MINTMSFVVVVKFDNVMQTYAALKRCTNRLANERRTWKRIGHHGIATTSKDYVAVMRHERRVCDRPA